MGLAPEMKLVIKRTFLEFVEDSSAAGPMRPRSFTDSVVNPTAEKADAEASAKASQMGVETKDAKADPLVNQSATEELKAFLGLDRACSEDLPSSPPAKLPSSPQRPPSSPGRRSPALPALREEEQPVDAGYPWPEKGLNALAPLSLPQCTMTAWWFPVSYEMEGMTQTVCMTSPASQSAHVVREDPLMYQQWAQDPRACSSSAGRRSSAKHSMSESPMETPEDQRTTVILRNLPNNYTRKMLLHLIDVEGFQCKYDFVYLPIDFGSQAGLGYAFVNLVTPSAAQAFWEHFEGFRRWCLPSEKVCALNWSSPIQGLTAHVERYRNSPVMHEGVPDDWKPVIFYGGDRIVFPPPTKAIKAPKIRNKASVLAH